MIRVRWIAVIFALIVLHALLAPPAHAEGICIGGGSAGVVNVTVPAVCIPVP